MEGLANAAQAPPQGKPAPAYNPYQPPHTAHLQLPPAYQPMPGQTYMLGQPYAPSPPHMRPYGTRTYGRTGGGRGRGTHNRGRHTNQSRANPTHPTPWPAPAYPPHNTQPTQHGFYSKPTDTNPVKYHKNWNYCWSCGYDVADDHHSSACPYPKPGHVYHATWENPCNGCQKNKHKTQM
eukprot:CCRYP_011031-RA/>CCRYP_011031-RA protein AED:0.84 eAED:0.44 QI:0/-1/0/1/-1/1/1/0/178